MLLGLGVQTLQAQRFGCVHHERRSTTRANTYSLPLPMEFDPQKIYRQPVVLVSFSDADFVVEEPVAYYHSVFNEKGYNFGVGLGCVADYFRDQSNGRLNLQFDIYGPIKVEQKAGGHGSNYFGNDVLQSAIKKLYETETTDFSIYDWDGDGEVNQVVFVAAGFSGNQTYGYIWPNTSTINASKLPGDINMNYASVSCELWEDRGLSGFGVIVHEFLHCLGLPDVYPLGAATMFSVMDEWDPMDGGNYINKGWCPSNLTAMEKMYLKWDMPEELTGPTTITGMKPVSEGGKTYLIRNSGYADEYYLLENRRQTGWDYGCPGNGLLITHVDYDFYNWVNNEVNISDAHYRCDLFHADGKDYRTWDPKNNGKDYGKYTIEGLMRSRYLSTSPYPYTNPETQLINDVLNDSSTPASTVYNKNAAGALLMSKAITNIRIADDGTVSFDFMGGTSGIQPIIEVTDTDNRWYDLQGRQLQGEPRHKGVYIHNRKKVAR